MVDGLNPQPVCLATWIQKVSARRGYYRVARQPGAIAIATDIRHFLEVLQLLLRHIRTVPPPTAEGLE